MRRIQNIAVLGSGVMGTGIALHLVNCGFNVWMLDLAVEGKTNRDRSKIAIDAISKARKSSPAPAYSKANYDKVKTGNFDDDLLVLKSCDWVIEVVKEDLNIKKALYDKVEKVVSPNCLVTSNTSGIPIHLLEAGRSEEFCKNFCGTHFFNPPRYLPLLEIIPGSKTDPEVIDFFMDFGKRYLGKLTVKAKDTPAFIANRIGVYSMAMTFDQGYKLDLPIQVVDKLTGVAIGRPKSGTFRLADVVGLDTAVAVINGIRMGNPHDAMAQKLIVPDYLSTLLKENHLGAKTGQGFYKKTEEKDEKGRPVILGLNLKNNEYEKDNNVSLASLALSKQIDELPKRIAAIFNHADAGGQLIRNSFAETFQYAAQLIPEIADQLYSIDDAMRAGFAWTYGPFEYWDVVGFDAGVSAIHALGYTIPEWITTMQSNGIKSFYEVRDGQRYYYDLGTMNYQVLPNVSTQINLHYLSGNKLVTSNDETRLYDIGDDVLCLEFTSKMNAIGGGILNGVQEAITRAEDGHWRGLVIGNHSPNFTVGANLMMVAMLAYEQEFMELDQAVRLFQNTTMRCRYSKIPVVAATQGYVFGGGCEMIMHCDATAAAAESYIGLVEVGVGLLPGGGGTKEFAVRTGDSFTAEEVKIPALINHFKTIATAQVATSAIEAYENDYLNTKDFTVLYQPDVIYRAKEKVIELSSQYVAPTPRQDIQVLGQQGLGALYTAAHSLLLGGYATEYDIHIARKIAWVLCGGDLSLPQMVSEQYLLDLEREAFLSLCGEQKTLQRIQHMLEKGKPLRN